MVVECFWAVRAWDCSIGAKDNVVVDIVVVLVIIYELDGLLREALC